VALPVVREATAVSPSVEEEREVQVHVEEVLQERGPENLERAGGVGLVGVGAPADNHLLLAVVQATPALLSAYVLGPRSVVGEQLLQRLHLPPAAGGLDHVRKRPEDGGAASAGMADEEVRRLLHRPSRPAVGATEARARRTVALEQLRWIGGLGEHAVDVGGADQR